MFVVWAHPQLNYLPLYMGYGYRSGLVVDPFRQIMAFNDVQQAPESCAIERPAFFKIVVASTVFSGRLFLRLLFLLP
ncbi:hypothetical protein LGR51_21890, partial [Pseudomonas sp. NP21570]|nr:hypothetical protein [Pseudomonas sp. NP21570]